LREAGHEIVAVAPEPSDIWIKRLEEMGARYVEAPLQRTGVNPVSDISLLFWLWRVFLREKPDTLFAFQPKAVIYGLLAAALAGVKRRVAMIEGLGLGFIKSGRGWKRRIVRFVMPRLYRLSLRFAHTVIFLNPDDEADFRKFNLLQSYARTLRIPGIGVDLHHYAASPVPEGMSVTFLMIARLLVDKGVREYAEAARLVRESHPHVRFVLLGGVDSGPAGLTLQEVNSWSWLDYAGEVGDVRPWLRACHAFVLPSYREGMPRSSLEALATGRAILTTDAPGTRETVVSGLNGLLVPVRDSAGLAAAMRDLLNHPNWFIEFGAASRRMAEDRFEVGVINRTIARVLTE
jgi:glycosyltransferase involved in cell wall biosynthesis